MTYSDPMVTYIDPTYLLTSTSLTWPINRLILEIKRLPVGGGGGGKVTQPNVV